MFIGLELISHTSRSTQAFPSKPNLKENNAEKKTCKPPFLEIVDIL